MRFFLLLSLLLPGAPRAEPAGWAIIRPDHLNLLYSAGERATFAIQVSNLPTDPAYGVYVTIREEGAGGAVSVPLTNGLGAHTTPALAGGAPRYEIVTHFTGPATDTDPAFDEVVQNDVIQLRVNQ